MAIYFRLDEIVDIMLSNGYEEEFEIAGQCEPQMSLANCRCQIVRYCERIGGL